MSITVVTVTFRQPERQAITIDDFYYRGYDLSTFPYPTGTGSRGLAVEFMNSGKILARYGFLLDGGDTMRTMYIFSSEEAYHEFDSHPRVAKAKAMWEGRDWEWTKIVEHCVDFMDLEKLYK